MKQLQILSVGILALGLCSVNAINYESTKYLPRCIVDDDQSDDSSEKEAAPTTPVQRAAKGNLPGNDDLAPNTEDDTSDLNNSSSDYDED